MYGTAIEGLLDVAPAATLGFVGFCFLMFAMGMYNPPDEDDGKTKTAVLVDDDPDVLRGLRALVESRTPFRVAGVAWSGAEALRVADAVTPDLVVVGVKLPEIDGIETARRLKEANPRVVVIGYSSPDDDATGTIMRRAGASASLVKGDDPDTIVRTISDFA
ncbi:MAG TPA: response regulator transcription factor [Actinomycetota bacterium]|nr:response regulator transcription factor [Actinomycetota bacterium]